MDAALKQAISLVVHYRWGERPASRAWQAKAKRRRFVRGLAPPIVPNGRLGNTLSSYARLLAGRRFCGPAWLTLKRGVILKMIFGV
jgi:hypothetical protein